MSIVRSNEIIVRKNAPVNAKSIFMNTFFQRLREERKRLGLNQEDFAHAGGVQKGAQIKYEQGERFPDVEYLYGISKIGVDIVYVFNGQHQSDNKNFVATPTLATSKFENLDVLMTLCSRDELALLHHFRCASMHGKEVIMDSATTAEKDVAAAA